MKIMNKLIFIAILFSSNIYGQSCWNTQDFADQEDLELEGKIALSFKDTITCKPISNADITLGNDTFKTNSDGKLIFDAPDSFIDTKMPMQVQKSGYITLTQRLPISVGTVWQKNFLLTKSIPLTSARFILSWGATPKDLDLHLVNKNFHISFRKKSGAAYKAKLNKDSMKGYGPETITLGKINKNEKYKLYVYNYSNEASLNQSSNVSIYLNGKLDRSVNLPDNLRNRCVEIATIYNNKAKYTLKDTELKNCK